MSLITYPSQTDPRAFLPAGFSLSQDVNQRAFASPFGGSEQAVDMLNDRWRVAMELPPCNHAEAAQREAFLNALRGQVNWTNLHHFGRPVPLGTLASSQGLIYDAAQGSDSITIATTAGATLLAGDMLGVDGLLLQCRADCTANADGVLVVPLVNRLRRAINGLRRASTATYVDGSGVLQTAAVDVPRFQGGALLVEGASTNQMIWSQGDLYASGGGTTPPSVSTSVTHLGLSCSSATFTAGSSIGFNGSRFVSAAPATVSMPAGQSAVGSSWISIDRELVGSESLGYYWFGCPIVFIDAENSWQFVGQWVRVQTSDDVTLAQTNQPIAYVASSPAAPVTVYWCRHQFEYGRQIATSYIPTAATTATRSADIITPVVWDRPSAPFRLVGRPALRYVPGYSDGLSLDFVEKVD